MLGISGDDPASHKVISLSLIINYHLFVLSISLEKIIHARLMHRDCVSILQSLLYFYIRKEQMWS